jgi:hypothetical protein
MKPQLIKVKTHTAFWFFLKAITSMILNFQGKIVRLYTRVDFEFGREYLGQLIDHVCKESLKSLFDVYHTTINSGAMGVYQSINVINEIIEKNIKTTHKPIPPGWVGDFKEAAKNLNII